MKSLFIAEAAHERLGQARRWLDGFGPTESVVVLAPTRGAADDFVWSAAAASRGRCGIERFTLAQYAAVVTAPLAASNNWTPLGALGASALAARAAQASQAAKELAYFGPVADTVGFSEALAVTISELRLNHIDPDALAGPAAPGADLALLLRRFEAALEVHRLSDLARLFDQARQCVDRRPVLLIDLFPKTRSESALLQALADAAADLCAVAPAGEPRLVGALERALGVSAEAGPEPDPRSLGRLRRFIFAAEDPPKREPDDSVLFFSAADEGRECVEVARRLREAARAGTPFDRMAVVLRQPAVYQPLIEDALRRASIPAYFSHGSLRPNPSGRAFLALLACASERLSASRFAEYLSLGQVPDRVEPKATQWVPLQGDLFTTAPAPPRATPALSAPKRSPLHWERLIVDASVIGGRERWQRRLDGLSAELRVQHSEAVRANDPRAEFLALQQERLDDLRGFAIPVIAALDGLPTMAVWREWRESLEQLASLTLRNPEAVLSLLAELRPMDEVGPVSIREVQEVLWRRLQFLRIEPAARRYGRVFIGTIPEAAGRSFDVVFVPGLAEGVFPAKALEDPLLLDDYRQTIGSLSTQADRVAAERLLLRTAIGAAARKFVASFPRMDISQGRPRVPSFYALDVLRAVRGEIPDLKQLELEASAASESFVGWPAPFDPKAAIDNAEYDLAVIGAIFRSSETPTAGSGAYLLTVNDRLARSLRARNARWSRTWGESDGIVSADPLTIEALGTHRLHERPHSPTSLQLFAACPYRFYLHGVAGLRPRDDAAPLEHLDPLTRGALFHETQFRLLTDLRADAVLPIETDRLDLVLRYADQALDRVAGEYHDRLSPAIERIWESEIEDIRTDLRGWLRLQAETSGTEWLPTHFELSFVLETGTHRDPASVRGDVVILGHVRLRGAIDLIEERTGVGTLRITDHKTGRAPQQAPGHVGSGEVLQPLLYALAAEELLHRTVDASQLSYCTQRGGYRTVPVPVTPDSRESLRATLALIDRAIQSGFFPAAPRANACQYCDFRIVCGPYEETRVKRKARPAEYLNPLLTLREMA